MRRLDAVRRRSPGGIRIWLMAARAADAAGRDRAGARRHRAGRASRSVFHPLRFIAALVGAIFIQVGTNLSNDYSDARRGADTEDRLGPVRVTAGGLVPPQQVLVATYVSFGVAVLAGHLPDRRRRLAAAADRRGLDPRRRAVHRRPAALRLRGPRRGVRVPVLRDRRGRRLVLRPGHAPAAGRRSRWRSRSGCSRRRSWSSTTSATSTPTAAPASGRSRSGSGASGPGCCSRRSSTRAYVLAPVTWLFGPLEPWLLLPLADAAAGRARSCALVRNRTDGPSLNGRWRRPGCCSWRSACCSPPGCC